MMKRKRVCIIGSGAAGLCAIRHISSNPDLEGIVYEQSNRIGGIWVFNEKVIPDSPNSPSLSPMYKGLRTNLPKEIMGFLDFPFEGPAESFVSHSDVLKYLENYAENFELLPYIQFNKRVSSVKPIFPDELAQIPPSSPPISPKWSVTVEEADQGDGSCRPSLHEFDSILVCNGHYSKPLIPDIPGLESYEGRTLHSSSYSTPHPFRDQKIVILGSGPSGIDIAIEISAVANEVIMSHKHPPHLSSPVFPSNMREKKPVVKLMGRKMIFEDGEEYEPDAFIISTGYEFDFPFLAPECGVTVKEGKIVGPIYRQMIHPGLPSLCFIGLPFQVCPFIMFDCQMRFFGKYLEGLISLPAQEEMNGEMETDKSLRKMTGLPLSRSHQLGSLQWQYFATLLAEEAEANRLASPTTRIQNLIQIPNEIELFLNRLQLVKEIYDRVGLRRQYATPQYRNDLVDFDFESNSYSFTEDKSVWKH